MNVKGFVVVLVGWGVCLFICCFVLFCGPVFCLSTGGVWTQPIHNTQGLSTKRARGGGRKGEAELGTRTGFQSGWERVPKGQEENGSFRQKPSPG